jgi:hypothetical protein
MTGTIGQSRELDRVRVFFGLSFGARSGTLRRRYQRRHRIEDASP